MNNFLDKTGLSYFWEKVKTWADNRFYKKTGGDLDGDITFVKKEGQVARTIGFGNTGADGTHLTFSANAIQFSGPDDSFLAMSGRKIELLGDATMDTDAVTYKQLKERSPSSPGNSQLGWVVTVVEDGDGGVKPGWKELPDIRPKSIAVTLLAASWSSNQQTVTATGVLADETKQLIQPMPAIESQSFYFAAGIMCTGQAADSLTFSCQTVPTENLTVYVVIQEVSI